MGRPRESRAEFGDFQTPLPLARDICALVAQCGFDPASVLEPTCGKGAFLKAALEAFRGATRFVGADRDPGHVQDARAEVAEAAAGRSVQVEVFEGDFFRVDWPALVARLPAPILILGNPPWVTNSALGAMGGSNLPPKSNHDGLRGIEALTGRSNFDISEAMLGPCLEWLAGASGMLAAICKTTVARKVLARAWAGGLPITAAETRRIDARRHFGAAVDACLLMVSVGPGARMGDCHAYESLDATAPATTFGPHDGGLVADVRRYDRWRGMAGRGLSGWRSGIKHDCAAVFELVPRGTSYANGLGEPVDVEPEVLFPLLKGSDLAGGHPPRRRLLVPQRAISGEPEQLRESAPRAWRYLLDHAARLDGRRSAVYRNRPRFSIFGVGPYSFSPWKLAIAGLCKELEFVAVPPFLGRPVVLDDTCYLFPCGTENECLALRDLLRSAPAREFLGSLAFRDAKRPITAEMLYTLSLSALAQELGVDGEAVRALARRQVSPQVGGSL